MADILRRSSLKRGQLLLEETLVSSHSRDLVPLGRRLRLRLQRSPHVWTDGAQVPTSAEHLGRIGRERIQKSNRIKKQLSSSNDSGDIAILYFYLNKDGLQLNSYNRIRTP